MTTRYMIATDLDGTLIGGDPEQLDELNVHIERMRHRLILVYASGRGLDSIRRLIAQESLLSPDIIVANVGTEIYYAPDWRREGAWPYLPADSWNVEQVMHAAVTFSEIERQPQENQGAGKCAFWLAERDSERVLPLLNAELSNSRLETKVIYSSGRDLDILPAGAGKGDAIRFLARKFRLPVTSIMTCGDSGNDLDMLTVGGPAVMVANAMSELVDSCPEQVFAATRTNAGGILESLRHHGWI